MDHRCPILGRPTPIRRVRRETVGLFLLFLAVVDAAVTVLMLRTQRGREANVVMSWLWEQDEHLFLAVKVLLTAAAILWLVRRGGPWHVRLGLLVGLAIYLPVNIVHLYNQLLLARLLD